MLVARRKYEMLDLRGSTPFTGQVIPGPPWLRTLRSINSVPTTSKECELARLGDQLVVLCLWSSPLTPRTCSPSVSRGWNTKVISTQRLKCLGCSYVEADVQFSLVIASRKGRLAQCLSNISISQAVSDGSFLLPHTLATATISKQDSNPNIVSHHGYQGHIRALPRV